MTLFWNAIAGRQHAVAKEGDIAGSAFHASVISGDFRAFGMFISLPFLLF